MVKSFFGTFPATIPVPLGAGIHLNLIEPHFPVTFTGTVWDFPSVSPQKPLLAGIKDNFETIIAPLIAVAASFAVLIPNPTCPSKSPMITKALNLVRCPARVCFWTGKILMTSSFNFGPKK